MLISDYFFDFLGLTNVDKNSVELLILKGVFLKIEGGDSEKANSIILYEI